MHLPGANPERDIIQGDDPGEGLSNAVHLYDIVHNQCLRIGLNPRDLLAESESSRPVVQG
jgi:hypothetical protein